ncbi:MAG: hypothetical protein LBF49_02565 [Puniceicoccales bacterium]|jgi:hypothetical protein|nr:hypothetical protein [Puniceicoccales bacterium]
MEGRNFKEVGHEQKRFVILERVENGVSTIFKVSPDKRKDFERIGAHTINDQFHLAANYADRDGNAVIKGILLGARVATVGFAYSSYGYKRPAYKITFLNEKGFEGWWY